MSSKTLATTSVTPDLRCSSWAREQRLDPIGTIGSYVGYLLIEWPLPWPRDIGMVPEIESVVEQAKAMGFRIQGLVRDQDGPRTIISYRRRKELDAGPGYTRRQWFGEADQVVAGCFELLESTAETDDLASASGAGELLVCTHGRRDRCCGSRGTVLTAALASRPEGIDDAHALWRTSHTGGHRFAPTALLFPEATAWAYLDEALLEAIVRREGDLENVIGCYRGYAGLETPQAQVIEREVLRELGWELFSMARWAETEGDAVRVHVRATSGETSTWEGSVGVGRSLPAPDCGSPIEESKKSELELEVGAFQRVR